MKSCIAPLTLRWTCCASFCLCRLGSEAPGCWLLSRKIFLSCEGVSTASLDGDWGSPRKGGGHSTTSEQQALYIPEEKEWETWASGKKNEIERSQTYHSSVGSTLKTAPFRGFLAALESHSLGINVQLNEECLCQGVFVLQSSESRYNKLQRGLNHWIIRSPFQILHKYTRSDVYAERQKRIHLWQTR